MRICLKGVDGVEVAPYVGAWIETCRSVMVNGVLKSHPTWVRGLKPSGWQHEQLYCRVAPYVGAWIETLLNKHLGEYAESHPTWVRGLKLNGTRHKVFYMSRTLRGCVD